MENIFVKRKISRKNGKYLGQNGKYLCKTEILKEKWKISWKNGKYLGKMENILVKRKIYLNNWAMKDLILTLQNIFRKRWGKKLLLDS